ncbi:MAG: tetratricopeptide repeat protein [Rhodothermales bacterium]|nr:tetratricopeptide repeat protein [Rhodothermales bacterium]MBO6779754.1 tetratricopeptide repeat protein [Rhodothermales bacterium]
MRPLLLATLLALTSAPLAAQPAAPNENEAFAQALRAFEEARFISAADRFARFDDRYSGSDLLPDALYYRGAALLAGGQEGQAIEVLSDFERRYPAHPRAYEARLALGRHYFENGQAREAIATLSAVLDAEPPEELAARALYWMGDAARQLRDTDAALNYYLRASDYRQTETAPAALYARGYLFIEQERYEEGAEAFELLAARHPDSEFSLSVGLALAEVYYELGDYLRTVEEIRARLPRLEEDFRDRAHFLLAESYNQLRDSENAIVYYQRFTEENPDSPFYRRARFGLGWNYHYQEAYQWASEEFAAVQDGSGDELDRDALYYEAVNLKLSAQPREAVDRFAAYARRYPGGELADHARFEQALTLYALRDWTGARDAFRQLIRDHGDSQLLGQGFMHLGNTLIATGHFDGALSAFNEAIDRNAASQEVRDEVVFQKAWLLYRNGRYEQATGAFSQLLDESPSGARAAESLFWMAESNFQLGNFSRSAELFRRYLREHPGGVHVEAAHYALGWSYFRQARYQDAIPQFEAFLRQHQGGSETIPYAADARLRLADSHFALKQYPQAIRVYGRLASDGDDYSLYQIGQAYANAGDPLEAISTFRQLLQSFPNSEWREESRYQLGYLYFLNQEYDQAIATFEELIRAHGLDPLAAKAQYGIGDAHFNAGRLDASVAAYLTVLERYASSPFATDAARGIQFALVASGDDERSSAIIDSFAVANPQSPLLDELRFRQAEVRYQSGQPDAALNDLLAFIRSAQDTRLLSEAYYYLGSIYSEQGQGTEAETYLREIMTRYPDSPRRVDAALQLGRIYLERGSHGRAEQAFSQAAAATGQGERRAEAVYGRSMALLAQGQVSEAEALLQEIVDAAPDDAGSMPAYLGLGRIYQQRGFSDRATTYYRRAASGSRGEAGAEALFRLGSMLRTAGNARGAIEELARMPTLFAGYSEWMARGYLEQARAFEAIGDRGEAVLMYENVIDFYPERPEAETARTERAQLTGDQ